MSAWLRRGLAAALAGATLLPVACADHDATALTVAISSEAQIPSELDSISIKITRGDSVRFAQTYTVDPATKTTDLPGTITIQPRDGESVADPVKVEISGNAQKKQVVLRAARVGFVEEKQKLLRMTLRYSCIDLPSGCTDPGQTCIGGRCVDSAVEPRALPDFISDAATFPAGKEGCFDDAEGSACLDQRTAVALPGGLAFTGDKPGEYTCRLTPGGAVDPARLNLFALWQQQTDKSRPRVLESQSAEGWTTVSTSPLVVELSGGLCDAIRDGRLIGLSYNAGPCAAKTEDVPLCQPPTPTTGAPFFDSACHRCAYFKETAAGPPGACRASYDAAKASGKPESDITAAIEAECLYDGRYDGAEECAVVGGCFFQRMSPFLGCKASCDGEPAPCVPCSDYPNLLAWSQCLEGWQPLDGASGSCAAACSGDNVGVCQ